MRCKVENGSLNASNATGGDIGKKRKESNMSILDLIVTVIGVMIFMAGIYEDMPGITLGGGLIVLLEVMQYIFKWIEKDD